MPTIRPHGGGCCGVRHYSGFGNDYGWIAQQGEGPTEEQIMRDLRQFGTNNGGRSRGKVVEAVITDNQFRRMPNLAERLRRAGFKIVNRFYNSSGGMCNVLHRTSGGRDLRQARVPWVRTLLREEAVPVEENA